MRYTKAQRLLQHQIHQHTPNTNNSKGLNVFGCWADIVGQDISDDVELTVLGCQADTLGTNCNKLLWGGGGGSLQLQ